MLVLQEDTELTKLVMSHPAVELTSKDWGRIGSFINKTAKQCRERWSNVLDPALVNLRSKWTDEELDLLFQAHSVLGSCWSKIADQYFPGRWVAQCFPMTVVYLFRNGLVGGGPMMSVACSPALAFP